MTCRGKNSAIVNPTTSAAASTSAAFFADYGPLLNTADGYWLAQAKLNEETGALEFPHDARAMRKAFGQGFIDAMEAARSARFEHGEKP